MIQFRWRGELLAGGGVEGLVTEVACVVDADDGILLLLFAIGCSSSVSVPEVPDCDDDERSL